MTQDQYNGIKARFPAFAKTVEYWALAKATAQKGSVSEYFADGFIEGTANAMTEQVGLGNEAFDFANFAKVEAERRVHEAEGNRDSEGSV